MSDENQGSEKPKLTLGQHLASIRTGRGLTLRQVEEATNKEVSNAYLSQIENDKIKQPSPNILNALAELYGVDYIDLMERAGYLPSTSIKPIGETGLRSTNKRHGKIATFAEYNLTEEEEAALVRYLKFMRHEKKRDESR